METFQGGCETNRRCVENVRKNRGFEEYIVERITDRWTDHIDFKGLLCFEPSSEHLMCSSFMDRIVVKSADIICRKQDCGSNKSVICLSVCCSMFDQRKRYIQRIGFIEIDVNDTSLRIHECKCRGEHLRMAAKIEPRCCQPYSTHVMLVELSVTIEFILCKAGVICRPENMFKPKYMKKDLYPQPI